MEVFLILWLYFNGWLLAILVLTADPIFVRWNTWVQTIVLALWPLLFVSVLIVHIAARTKRAIERRRGR